jgi:hypothetical protein
VINVMMRDEDRLRLGGLESGENDLSGDALAGVDQVGSSVYDEQARRLGARPDDAGAASRPE